MLAGLSNAPQYLTNEYESQRNGCVVGSDVDSVILPADACGGDGVLAFANKRNKVKSFFMTNLFYFCYCSELFCM